MNPTMEESLGSWGGEILHLHQDIVACKQQKAGKHTGLCFGMTKHQAILN